MSNEQTAHLLPDEVEMLERANAATDVGEWKDGEIVVGGWEVKDFDGTTIHTRNHHPQLKAPSPIVCLSVGVKEPKYRVHIRENDAKFIAAARTDVPELLRRLAEARRELADCQAALRNERHELRGR